MNPTFPRAAAVLLAIAPLALCRAQSPGEAPVVPDSCRTFGLVVDIQASPYLSSPNAFRDGGYTISLGFGVNINPRLQVAINVYTGREGVPPGSEKPVDGWLPLGGASLEATMFFSGASALRPYAAAGYGLYTLAGHDGYNGGGLHLESGVQWDFALRFSLRAGVQIASIRYHDPTGEGYQTAGFQPFTDHSVGAAIRCAFYPSILP